MSSTLSIIQCSLSTSLPCLNLITSKQAFLLEFTRANTSSSGTFIDTTFCFSSRFFIALILSRSFAAFSNSIASEYSYILLSISSTDFFAPPLRNAVASLIAAAYSSFVILPLQGAQQMPIKPLRHGRDLL